MRYCAECGHELGERTIAGRVRPACPRCGTVVFADPKLAVVDIRPLRRLGRPVTLAQVKADPAFADFALVRQGRLSVVPVSPEQWARLMALAGEE